MQRAVFIKVLMYVVVVAGALTIGDIWFDIFNEETFGKVLLTAVILVGIIGVVIAARNDIDDESRKKKDGYFN